MIASSLLDDVLAKPDSLAALAQAADDGLLTRCGPFLERRFRRYRLIGMGASYLAAAQAASRMRSLGLDAAADPASSRYGYPMDRETLTVAVSASGATSEVLDAVDRLDGHFPVLALTDDPTSPLTERAGAVLPMLAGDGVRTCRTFGHTGLLLHGLTIAWTGGLPRMVARDVAVLAERVAEATSDLVERRGQWLDDACDRLDGWSERPAGEPPRGEAGAPPPTALCALAPGERLAAAHRSALVLRTGARRPADSCESADWLNGHAHLTHPDSGLAYRALVITGSRADRAVLRRLTSRGAEVVVVGEGPDLDDDLDGAPGDRGRRPLAVRFPRDDDHDVVLHTAATVAELVAATLA